MSDCIRDHGMAHEVTLCIRWDGRKVWVCHLCDWKVGRHQHQAKEV